MQPHADPRPTAPERPEDYLCCGRGCMHCVFDVYDESRARYEGQLRDWEARQRGDVVEGYAWIPGGELYYREVGCGRPLIVIHGGPDFDHRYLLPDMDRLADRYRLIYYDQRGRGQTRGKVILETLGIETYVRDLEALRQHLRLDPVAILGHSWGGIVAMHYALRNPECLSHLVLLNPAPATNDDWQVARAERIRRGSAYREAFAALIPAMTQEQVQIGEAIENRLMEGLFWAPGFDMTPQLASLRVPTLIIHGEQDFIAVDASARIAAAIPGARLEVLRGSDHFSYIDASEGVRAALEGFLGAT